MSFPILSIFIILSLSLVNAQNSASANIIANAVANGGAADVIVEAAASGSPYGRVIAEGIAEAQSSGNGEAVASAFAEAISRTNGCRCPAQDAIAQAIAESLVTVGPQAQACVAALTLAKSEGGCDAIATSLAAAQAIAISLGEASAFADAVAIAEVADCLPTPPATPSRARAVVTAATYGGQAFVNTLNEAEGNAESNANGIATALLGDTELVAQGLGAAVAYGGSVLVVSEVLAKLASDGNVQTLATSIAEIAGQGEASATAEAIVASVARNLEVTAQAIAEALSDSENGVAVSEAVAEALAKYQSEGLVEAVTQAVAESIDGGNAKATGRALANLAETANVFAVAEVIATAVENGLAEATSDVVAEAVCWWGNARNALEEVSALAQAIAEASANSEAVAESVGRAIAREAINVAVAAAEVFAEAVAKENADAFVRGFANTLVREGSCSTVAEALGEASALGAGEAALQVITLAGCEFGPLITQRRISCSRTIRECRASNARCCAVELSSLIPGQVCTSASRDLTYSGTCRSDASRVVLQPQLGSGCYCQFL
eukprot:TRINITY_DN771_c0_g1_i5.p1 TRINITY_DN771_c0_g1~~TRINITY_DN771_c0_g1_i5.p1  ORF type:complete len:554 (-),score=131.33 TRINITY_DN771_c0_g1_i5:224-1885(-)